MNMKEIKKVLFSGKGSIKISYHTKSRLKKRGYSKGDLVAALLNGRIIERQGIHKVLVAGRDKDNNPIIIVIAKDGVNDFTVVTVMPPIDRRFKECV